MSLDFSTAISSFNTEYNLNAIGEYNKLLQGNASFEVEKADTEFSKALEKASKSAPLKDKNVQNGLGSFMDKVALGLGDGLNSVNDLKLEADRMQEDIAKGGPTSIHDAMIAAEKADLSLKMAIQVRNRIIDAYTQLTQMSM